MMTYNVNSRAWCTPIITLHHDDHVDAASPVVLQTAAPVTLQYALHLSIGVIDLVAARVQLSHRRRLSQSVDRLRLDKAARRIVVGHDVADDVVHGVPLVVVVDVDDRAAVNGVHFNVERSSCAMRRLATVQHALVNQDRLLLL